MLRSLSLSLTFFVFLDHHSLHAYLSTLSHYTLSLSLCLSLSFLLSLSLFSLSTARSTLSDTMRPPRSLAQTMIRCKKCACLSERSACSRFETDANGMRHERTLMCKNRVAGAHHLECGQPLLEERIVDGATRCVVARSQEYFFFGIIKQLQAMLQRPVVVENLWHHLNWPQQRGVLRDIYDGAEWQRWKQQQWFTNPFVFQGALAWYRIQLSARVFFLLTLGIVCMLSLTPVDSLLRRSSPVALRISEDGYQPFKDTNSNTTPVFAEILNLPAPLRQQIPFQIPIALVPGPKEVASKSYFEILKPIVDELQQLYVGVDMPVYLPGQDRVESRRVSAVLFLTSFDTPACRKVRRSRMRPL